MYLDKSDVPVNFDLLKLTDRDLSAIKEVTDLQIFDSTSNSFHPNGLFSTTIFGSVGSEFRNRMFGHIKLKRDFIHPHVYYCIMKLKSFYISIMEGKSTAIWNSKTSSFEESTDEGCDTGYVFFFSKLKELKFNSTGSEEREFYIREFEKSRNEDSMVFKELLVLPAGLRDYTVDDNGKPQEDEVNSIYRKIMYQVSLIDSNSLKLKPENYNEAFSSIQNLLLELITYFSSLLEGKNKLIMGKWLSRKIFNSTRNVASSNIENISSINDHDKLSLKETRLGLHQMLKTIMPLSLYDIKTKYLSSIFIDNANTVTLTNLQTFKKEIVTSIPVQKEIELWSSQTGLEKVVEKFGNISLRHKPVLLNKGKNCLGLIYKDDKYFKFFQDIDELPENLDRKNVSPITLAEILYISIAHRSGNTPGLVARYPIIEFGSVYPTFFKLKTTVTTVSLTELNEIWEPSENVFPSFPIVGIDFYDTMSVHPTHLGRLGGDFDGDVFSSIGLLSEESRFEVANYLNKRSFYVSSSNELNFKLGVEPLEKALAFLTK